MFRALVPFFFSSWSFSLTAGYPPLALFPFKFSCILLNCANFSLCLPLVSPTVFAFSIFISISHFPIVPSPSFSLHGLLALFFLPPLLGLFSLPSFYSQALLPSRFVSLPPLNSQTPIFLPSLIPFRSFCLCRKLAISVSVPLRGGSSAPTRRRDRPPPRGAERTRHRQV